MLFGIPESEEAKLCVLGMGWIIFLQEGLL